MSEPASIKPSRNDDAPSLDPAAIEHAYRRERHRRHERIVRHDHARTSNARFYLVLALLLFLTVVIALGALRQIQSTFGI